MYRHVTDFSVGYKGSIPMRGLHSVKKSRDVDPRCHVLKSSGECAGDRIYVLERETVVSGAAEGFNTKAGASYQNQMVR